MMKCRICGNDCNETILNFAAPSITSNSQRMDVRTVCYSCVACDHVQKPDFADLGDFYDSNYKISTDSEEFDQLYAVVNDKKIFRIDMQIEIVTRLLSIKPGDRVLDYGCGKATTLKGVYNSVENIKPSVFDVSEDYVTFWQKWVDPSEQATYEMPLSWSNRFDAVMAHFVLEHTAEPAAVLSEISSVLNDNGRAFISVPNTLENFGDLLVVDHVNHFTDTSMQLAAQKAGLYVESTHHNEFRGTLIFILKKSSVSTSDKEPPPRIEEFKEIATFWNKARDLVKISSQNLPNEEVAIYGAGFYGSLIANWLASRQKIVCFLDQNSHLQNNKHFGISVLNPADIPNTVQAVYAGLNPASSKAIMAEWCSKSGFDPARVVYLFREK